MSRAPQPTTPALLRDSEPEVHDLAHIATLLRVVSEEGGPIVPEVAEAVSFLAYLASDRVDILRKALSGVAT